MKRFIYYAAICVMVIMVIFFLFYILQADESNKFVFNADIFLIVAIFFIFLISIVFTWFEDKAEEKRKKQILRITSEQTIREISYPWHWIYAIRSGVELFIVYAPIIGILIGIEVAFNKRTESFEGLILAIIIWFMACISIFFWLQKIIFLLSKAYYTYKKGSFLSANSYGVDYCLFPKIPWQHVQSISPEISKFRIRFKFIHYGVCLTLDEAWIQQHPIPRWWAYIWFFSRRTKRLKARNILYLPCNPLGENMLVAAAELNVLHKKHLLRIEAWSPKLIELLTEYGAPQPKKWLEEKMEDIRQELNDLNQQDTLDETGHLIVDYYLEQLYDLFSPDGGTHAKYFMKDVAYHKLSFKQEKLLNELKEINKAIDQIDTHENLTAEQTARRDTLTKQALDVVEKNGKISDQIHEILHNDILPRLKN